MEPDPGSLAGSDWQLVEIQSMSDEIGTEVPDDPSLYTLSFGTEGDVVMQLNCNRGTGTWNADSFSETGGSLRFGPLAVTRAFCPPPSLDERIARDLDYVRTYILEGDRLYMSLMADGGIYVWQRIGAAP